MGPTPAPVSKPARLEISGGKSAYIEPVRRKIGLFVKHSQSTTSNLTVYRVLNEDKSVHMAFCFELKNNKYFPVVERNSKKKICFKIQAQGESEKFSTRFLFRWAENNGEYGSLCSVAEPSQYLNVSNNEVTLSPDPLLGFRVQFLEANNFNIRMLSGQNSGVGEGHEGHSRHAVQRKALQWEATRGGRKTSKKKKSGF